MLTQLNRLCANLFDMIVYYGQISSFMINPNGLHPHVPSHDTDTPFTLALLIRSETGFAPLRAFTLHQLIRINNLIRIKLNHLLEVVSHRFSLLRDQITSVDANRTRTKEEQIEINARGYICIYGVACQELSRSRSSARLSTKYHCKLSVAIL